MEASDVQLETMRCEVKGPVAHVTLNRPDVLNAMNVQWAHDFLAIAEDLKRNSQVKIEGAFPPRVPLGVVPGLRTGSAGH